MSNTNYDSIDIEYSYCGDYEVSDDGDFQDTTYDQIQSLVQEIQTVCNSSIGDWQENPNYAASLTDYVGEPNNRITSRNITDRIKTSLIGNNVVRADDLTINIIPIDRYKVFILVSVKVASTQNNSVLTDGSVVVSLVFDYTEQGISFIDNATQY